MMSSSRSVNLHPIPHPTTTTHNPIHSITLRSSYHHRPILCLASNSTNSTNTVYTSSVQSPPSVTHWNLTQRHVIALNFIACATAVSATWLFLSAIPTLLAFKRAAESLEKLLDVTREELPDTMAAVRLSGMEISDLTMELSDLGQEITQGVKSSTRAVRLAEERLRRLTNMNPSGGGPNETRTSRTSGS
ncbi:hypothetical protein CTI12_AA107060 [Artemisia annua]|uniref:Transmembrane protein n=1 Tax=Artemisia annua TaxID=35608 RepID=A0A2U1PTC5_ARTAN|nr:hypothetical protein CTI12_AA107060 [Artemisia annua]